MSNPSRCPLLLLGVFLTIWLLPLAVEAAQPLPLPEGMLLFSGKRDGQWDLYLWNPEPALEGTVTAITRTAEPEGNPVWWPRQRMVVCSQQWADGRWALMGFSLDGAEIWHQATPRANLGWPQPSPWDNRVLAVREDPATGETQPGMCEYPRLGFKPFPPTGAPGGQMAWVSPEEILVTRQSGEGFDLCHRSMIGGEERVLVHGGRNWLPAAAPAGGAPLLFTRRAGQTGSVFRLLPRPDAPWEYEDCTLARTYDWQPAVTPDGEGVVFLSLREGRFRVVYRRLDGAGEREIPLPGFTAVYHPSWIHP